jgi:hypothetical protein
MLVVAVPPEQPPTSATGDGGDNIERSERILFSASKIKVRSLSFSTYFCFFFHILNLLHFLVV